ncbi:SDR family NAD(P)-dependent oxidoreductase [Pseudarthrobacter oxydans]|uniref:SDR family NAD(P)-dependent oxidoreductase n=1 Tax=Pseudarthrobacter oxydans TaxID=1671 RepID=UPI0037FA3CEF
MTDSATIDSKVQPLTIQQLFDLTGHVALVTGATGGLGKAAALALAQAGAKVVVTGLAEQRPDLVAEEFNDQGLNAFGYACDVTDHEQLKGLVGAAMAQWGAIDVLFCNAGIAADTGPLLQATDEQFNLMLDVNLRSVLHLCNLVIPQMAARKTGSVIIMSSLSGLRGNKFLGLYGITKAANAQLARNLAVQWGPDNIRVNVLSPGVIDTEFARPITSDAEASATRLEKTPLRRFGKPHHVAAAVVYLASEAGSFTTGHNLIIDGGTMVSD